MNTVTQGVSPKAPAAAGAVAGSGLLASLINLLAVGHFDTTSIILALSGSAGGLLAYAAAYVAKPGPVHTAFEDAIAVAGTIEHTDPGLAAKVEAIVKTELAKIPASLEPLEHAVEDAVHPAEADPAVVGASLADPALDSAAYVDPAAQALLLSGGHTHLGDVPAPAEQPAPAPAPEAAPAPPVPVAASVPGQPPVA